MTRLAHTLALGLSLGALYALMGASVALVYQVSRVPNVAFVAIGTAAAVLHWDLATPGGLLGGGMGWWPAMAAALLFAAVLGLVTEVLVRPLAGRTMPSLLLLLGWTAALLAGANALWGSEPKFLASAWSGSLLVVGDFVVRRQDVASLVIAAVCLAGLFLLYRHTRFGIALRASAADLEAAGMVGIDALWLSRAAWVISSMLAAIAVTLVAHPVLSSTYEQAVYVPFAFGAALLGGFRSLPLAVAGGLVLGVVPALVEPADTLAGFGGARNLVAFALIALLLWKRPGLLLRSGSAAPPEPAAPPLPAAPPVPAARVPGWARGGLLVALVAGLAVAVPVLSNDAALSAWVQGISVFLVCASIVVVAGWSGEAPLGQVAFAGFSAYMASNLAVRLGAPHILAVPLAAMAAVPLAILVALPAVRARGRLPFAVVSIGLTVVASSFLWGPGADWFTGSRPDLPRPDWMEILSSRPAVSYYLFALATAAGVLWFATNLRRSRVGRAITAVRDAEAAAASAGVDPVRYRLVALAFSAFVAGLGGVLHAYLAGTIEPTRFAAFLSVQYLLYTVVGGVHSLAGTAVVVWAFEVAPVLQGGADGFSPGAVVVLGLLAVAAARFAPGGVAGVVRRLTVRGPVAVTVSGDRPATRAPARRHGGDHGR